MKGNVVNGLIAVMVGAVLIFSMVVPIMNNATLGTEYVSESLTNSTLTASSITYFNTSCYPIRTDTTYLTVLNASDVDVTSQFTVADSGTYGGLKFTNTSLVNDTVGYYISDMTVDYRCYDSAYIDSSTSRTMASYIVPLVLIILIVGLTGFLM